MRSYSVRARPRRLATALVATSLLSVVAAAPAYAAPPPAARAATAAAPPAAARIETARSTRPVAPGVTLTSVDRYDATGWLRTDALSTDLAGGAKVGYLSSGEVSKVEPVRASAGRTRAVAAVNGDFFDINNSGAALGIGIQSGQMVQSPVADHNNAVGITASGLGEVVQIYFDGSATLPTGGAVTLTQFNNMVQTDGVGLFTPVWGSYPRARAVAGAARVTEVTLVDGRVSAVSATAGSGSIPAGATVLLGREAGADALAGLAVGDPVGVSYRPRSSDGQGLSTAVGGRSVLVRDGVPQDISGDTTLEPRTALGFSADGRRMFITTVDGKQADSRGVTLTEMGRLMAESGAYQALELDGGGSSTLLARKPGGSEVKVENSPSDGSERPVANGLAIYAPVGSGRLTGFWVETAIDPATAPGDGPVRGGRPDRVFPGLTRQLTAAGYDETYGPAAGKPQWSVEAPWRGRVDRDGVFHAGISGGATVTASARGGARGRIALTVLGPLTRVRSTAERVALRDQASTATFGLVGSDAEGSSAPIEPADARLDYDHSLFQITPGANGTFEVRGSQPHAAGLVTVHVAGTSTVIPVTIGLDDQMVAGFDDAASWTFSQARASGSVTPVAGHTGTGLKMSYDYTRSTATRAAYANPPAIVDIPGQPLAFTMWVNSSGHGEWPSLHLIDGLGQDLVLRGPYLTWTGWQQIEFTVPAGTTYPLKLRRFYTAETKADAQYTSDIVIDDIVAKVPPPVNAPAAAARTDPLVVTDGTVAGAPWRFAVLSDAQFVARDPDSEIVRNARRALREIKAAKPDFLLIDGDFVDEGSPEDLALAKRILDEELGGELPYYYVPGNHEVMGGKIDNFKAAFGDAYGVFDHAGTRFVTLDTSSLTLRGGGFDQIEMLRAALDSAAADPAIGSVVVVEHVPPRDPTPAKASQLNDRKEAALLEQWLAEFQRSTGKGALFIGGHVGLFNASRVEGVPYFINGNSGKTPAAAPGDGGFWGWTMFGVDPVSAREAAQARHDPEAGPPSWVRAETRVRVDALALDAPPSVAIGAPATVTATVTQGGREVPVRFPVSADWSASPSVYIGDRSGVRPWHTAWFDPRTGRLTALRPSGPVILAVTVNGVTTRATIALAATQREVSISAVEDRTGPR